MTERITRKSRCVELWEAGWFGVRWSCWRTLGELEASSYRDLVAIRYLSNGVGNGPCVYDLPFERVRDEVTRLVSEGWPENRLYFNASNNPDAAILVQGEYWNGGDRWGYFLHSRAKVKMRNALKVAPEVSTGLRSELILRAAMTPSSWSDFEELRTRYPEHVFELSVWDSRFLGHGRNAMFWEIRAY